MRNVAIVMLVLACAAESAPAAPSETGNFRLLQGPMVGAVSPDGFQVWMRVTGPYACGVEYDTDPGFSQPQQSPTVEARPENDRCVVVPVTGLKPDTRYYYRPTINGSTARPFNGAPPMRTRTAPEPGVKTPFRIMFGSCPRYAEDPVQPIWRAIQDCEPDLFFWIGDNIYGDSLDPEVLAEEYRRQRDVVYLQPVLHNVPQLAVWDDHDFGLNDHDGSHPGKMASLEVFRRYWANPGYGLPDVPGVFFKSSYGAVDFFFLDGRYYRDPNDAPDGPDKTYLGADQLAWLKAGLTASTAVFKVIVSGSGFNDGKGPKGDSWASFLNERNELFNFIRDNEVEGVLLLSGDTHVGEFNCIPWSSEGGYDLYELVSSPLAQTPSTGNRARNPERRIRPVYDQACNAGVLEFDFRAEPLVRMNLVNTNRDYAWDTVTIRASELKNGVASWRDKVR
ncbi:MAG: alkaline phosphatase D family protein [Candidatus Hydrogenedentes bacterium]|nr:alkaline phosphatase D family protein [Candidatus Hydrogenedentota bacterium]